MTRLKVLSPIALVLLLVASCAGELDDSEEFSASEQPIVNGSIETGWSGVGALTFSYPGYGYAGSFCTATLIDSRWLLTAAHCLIEHDGFEITTQMTEFYVGNDANPEWDGSRPAGAFYATDAFFVHQGYDDTTLENDIGLVHLAQSVPETAIPYNTSSLSSSVEGESIFYVGYGVTDGINQNGGGVKRSTSVNLGQLYTDTFMSDYDGSGTCFGDSGGPALYQIAGQWRVIGVNSGVSSTSGDPCRGTYFTTRVDYFEPWINTILSGGTPSCQTQPGMCRCDSACQGSGVCNNNLCPVLDCEEVYTCLTDCGNDSRCASDCYAQGSTTAQNQLDSMLGCMENNCGSVPDADYQQCAIDNCGTQIDTCLPTPVGTQTCEAAYGCMVDCPANDQQCATDCFYTANATGQAQLDDMFACFGTCDSVPDDQWSGCVSDNCGTELDACFPPANCSLTGGDCPNGEACYLSSSGASDCFESDGVAVGQACNADIVDTLVCDDGAICVPNSQLGSQGTCVSFCYNAGACQGDDICSVLGWSEDPTLGVCAPEGTCIDLDNDGTCSEDDCDDNNAAAHPGASEICDDNADNDCDGTVDENCSGEPCDDLDGDGTCADNDCDDNNPGMHPGLGETCDGLDNNCDGTVDEGCEGVCVDSDGDGSCSSVDCDDNDASINPATAEVCFDKIDNNCDGSVDEECGSPSFADDDKGSGGSSSGGCSVASPTLPSQPTGLALLLLGLAAVVVRRRS